MSNAGAVQIGAASRRQFNTSDGIKPTIMHCKRVDVDKENKAELDKLHGEAIAFEAKLNGVTQSEDENAIAPHWLYLKIGYRNHTRR